jgi:hypothetical protein
MLDPKTEKYLSFREPNDGRGVYFPDAVVDPLMSAAQRVPQAAVQPRPEAVTGPQLPWDKSRQLILDALEAFDPRLKTRAQALFDAGFDKAAELNTLQPENDSIATGSSRWQLKQIDTGLSHSVMRSLPANSPRSKLNPDNPNPYAVIQFEHDFTINGAIYLAHELGHALADGYINENLRGKPNTTPEHMNELQAYFVQHIVYDYLRRSPDKALATAAQEHFEGTMRYNLALLPAALPELAAQKADPQRPATEPPDPTGPSDAIQRLHSRPASILTALALYTQAERNPEARHSIVEAVLGGQGPKDVVAALETAGISSPVAMNRLAAQTIKTALSPLPEPRREGLSAAFGTAADAVAAATVLPKSGKRLDVAATATASPLISRA